MSRLGSLAQLTACLRGEMPVAPDWPAIVALANRALVTPQLYGAIVQAGATQRLPEDVRTFLCEVFKRNRERNRRLSAQLTDALRALNDAGIEPILLKGAAVWATSGRGLEFDRILTDLDILVKPSEVEHALAAFDRAGFPCAARHHGLHAVAELGRATDVGFIDLHQRPPGPFGIAHVDNLDSFCTQISWSGTRAKAPAPAIQILFTVLHDQFHDGDYWRGGVVLRHLLDIAELSKIPQSVDWLLLHELCKTSLVRSALGTQLVAAERFLGAAVPASVTRRRWARFQHQRHIWQFMYPSLSVPLSLVAAITEWPGLLAHRALNEPLRRGAVGPRTEAPRAVSVARLIRKASSRLRRLRRVLSPRPGKL
jgi:hypothetical protein